MQQIKIWLNMMSLMLFCQFHLSAQPDNLAKKAREAMLPCTRFMVEQVSANGDYLGISCQTFPEGGAIWRSAKLIPAWRPFVSWTN
jgi:hypothetical protein